METGDSLVCSIGEPFPLHPIGGQGAGAAPQAARTVWPTLVSAVSQICRALFWPISVRAGPIGIVNVVCASDGKRRQRAQTHSSTVIRSGRYPTDFRHVTQEHRLVLNWRLI